MQSDRLQRQIDRLLDEADEAIRRLDWTTVRDRVEAVLALDGRNADAQAYLTAAQEKLREAAASPSVESDKVRADSQPTSQAAPQPASFCDGRYEVKRFLGEGGKKRVYLAHDTKLDRDVAFALIKTDGLDDEGLLRIKREAQAMGRLGDHPHIVSVHDIGEDPAVGAGGWGLGVGGASPTPSPQPYMVTQLMAGGDLENLIASAENHRIPLAEALTIAAQVCQALEHAHSHGIVHRDLKPGNVWLTADGTAKLGDFGLALALDKARLTQTGMMVGTVSYMPPEQALGGDVTPHSDLYSLGVMLYEMVTGRPPFVGDESVAIITQHLNTPPVAPSWHAPDLPPGLEVLILRLLEKDPSQRPASASEVRQMLAGASAGDRGWGIGVGEGSTSQPSTPSPQPPTPSPIYRRIFVGRETDLRQLESAFDAALSGQGSLRMVVGEPGIGKTSLCEQLATYAAMRGGRTLVGHCYEEGSLSLPYLPFVEAMRSYVLAREPDGLKQDLGSGAADVARLVSEIRDKVDLSSGPSLNPSAVSGQAVGGGVGVGGHSPDPEEERYRLLQAVTTFLRNASSVQPLLLILEDLHDGDRGTLDLLLHLARNLPGTRLLIVGTYRDIEVDRTHPLSAALADLRRVGGFDRVLLRGLTPDEVQRMMSGITGQQVSWQLAEAVHRQTEGNPLFIQEVLRYLVEEGLITRGEGRWQRSGATPLEMQIPEGLRDVIGRRLSRLSAECNRVLTMAAVIGRDFELRSLEAMAGLAEEQLVQALEEAIRVGVLREQARPGGVQYRFAHAFFRQTLYEELSAARRLRLHQQVARVLEAQYAARLQEHATELAEHFAHSTDPEDLRKAVAYGKAAARRAVEVNAYGEAVQHLERALDVQEVLDPSDDAERCDLLLGLGRALGPAGEPGRAFEQVAPQAFALAEGLEDRDRASSACQLALDAMGRYAGAVARRLPIYAHWAERADRYAQLGTIERVMADLARASVSYTNMQFAEFHRLEREALQLARDLGDAETLFRAASMAMWGWWPAVHARWQQDLADEFASRSREGVSLRILAQVLEYCCVRLLAAGRRPEAEQLGRELAEVASKANDVDLTFAPSHVEALWAILDGRLDAAVWAVNRVIERGTEVGMPVRARVLVEGQMGHVLAWLGRPQEALDMLFEADRSAGLGLPAVNQRSGRQALHLAQLGRVPEAQETLHELLARLPIDGGDDDPPAGVAVDLLETAILVEDREVAARIAPAMGEMAATPTATFLIGAVARHVGSAAALLGDSAAARAHYRRALDWATAIRHRPEIALTRLAMAELALGEAVSGQPSAVSHEVDEAKLTADKLKAEGSQHLDFAIEEFRAMKMQPSLERALRHKGILNA